MLFFEQKSFQILWEITVVIKLIFNAVNQEYFNAQYTNSGWTTVMSQKIIYRLEQEQQARITLNSEFDLSNDKANNAKQKVHLAMFESRKNIVSYKPFVS